jgi:hypothetical protein
MTNVLVFFFDFFSLNVHAYIYISSRHHYNLQLEGFSNKKRHDSNDTISVHFTFEI